MRSTEHLIINPKGGNQTVISAKSKKWKQSECEFDAFNADLLVEGCLLEIT